MKQLEVIIVLLLIIIKEGSYSYGCFEDERIALLQLKSSFHYSSYTYRSFDSWGIENDNDNCCEWEGVECSSSTRRLTHLFVDGGDFWDTEWKFNASLFFPFQQLTTLFLEGIFIGSSVHNQGFDRLSTLENFDSLHLSDNKFKDIKTIISSIGRISSLKSLSLNYTGLNSITDIQGLVRLENLEVLDLSGNNFNNSIFSIVSGFSSLKSLSLGYNALTDSKGFDILSRLENLESLDLSYNSYNMDKSILSFISNISSLKSLYLSGNGLNSTTGIRGGLSKLVNLEVLDLSGNNFNNSIMLSLACISSLKTLDLSYNGLKGTIDLQELDTLGNLEVLALSGNQITKVVASRDIGALPRNLSVILLDYITPENGSSSNVQLHSLGAYPNLKTIYLRGNHFEGPIFFQEEGNLSNLEELYLDDSFLDDKSFESLEGLSSLKHLFLTTGAYGGAVPETKFRFSRFFNFKSLEILDLSGNGFDNNILKDIGKSTSLKTLRLSNCTLSDSLPTTEGLCNLRNLENLDLSSNELNGTLPQCIANLTSLQKLDLSYNNFIGSISISPLRSLTSLQELRFSNNLFEVPLSLEPFFNHSNLKYLVGQGNHIIYEDHVKVQDSTPKFQLEELWLSSHGNGNGTRNGGGFPKFLWHQHDLQWFYLSNIQLKGEFPAWLLENNTNLVILYLANTSLSGPLHLPNHSHKDLQYLDISNNDLNGTMPIEIGQILPNLDYLNLSRNGLVGGMPSSFGKMSSMLEVLDLSYNELSGEIPGDLEIGSVNKRLRVLDASNNHLSGSIPGWILNMPSLHILDLSENNFSKILPSACIATSQIKLVYLSRNMLQGSVGTAFQNCSELISLDLSHNYFSGTIPKWVGKLPELSYLLMSHNNFEGEIPTELCNLEKLSLFDLSNNNFSGHVLSCIKAIVSQWDLFDKMPPLEFTTKSITYYISESVLKYMAGIDLSCNNFSGEIPTEIGNLSTIQVLNLSHNRLIGPIPESFSNLAKIESLDLSYNKLDGKIPSQLRGLNFLSHFSVAHNNLSGRTPEMVGQFATFENTSYEGNPSLCGPPLIRSCSATSHEEEEEDGGFMDMEAFYASCVVSYIIMLLTIGAVLYVNPYWRRRWFYMIEVSLTNCYYFIEDHVLPLFKLRAP